MRKSTFKTEKDVEIYEKLYRDRKSNLYYIAYGILHNASDAEDAVHAGFESFFKSFSYYRGKPYKELQNILSGIVAHEAVDIIRARGLEERFLDRLAFYEKYQMESKADILEQIIDQFEKSQIMFAISKLEAGERYLLYLRYELNMKPKEIGAALRLSSGVVRKKLFFIRNKLAEILKNVE